ncbi:exported hypothetical protein [Mesorhizobium plurifarium]|uniref:Uncharacterized protein n=1 Tax=Mesorhizobium plurifarium TaxID=69974 RepID=A0A090DMI8_MESPL|nr:exported hypothetical protein [Mesorhizobium plurifarium]
MLKVFGNILVGSLALALFVAIAGAITALGGSIGEFPTLKQLGGSVSILGVFGFLLPLFCFVTSLGSGRRAKLAAGVSNDRR